MQPLPFLNPLCSSPTRSSVIPLTLSIIILSYTLPTTFKTLIPLYIPQSFLSPFPLYTGSITASLQSVGTSPLSHHILKILYNHLHTTSSPAFIISLTIPSSPAAFPLFNLFMAVILPNSPYSLNNPLNSSSQSPS